MRADLGIRGDGVVLVEMQGSNSLAGKGIRPVESSFVTPESWHRVDLWWSDLFGAPVTRLWRAPVTIAMHAGLGDYPGAFVVERQGHVQVSLPDWVTAAQVRQLEQATPDALASREFWETWTPTAEMIERKPRLAQYANGVPGGETNPLGARALYLYQGGRDTLFRLHGTNEPWLIGTAVSNGCIRLTNDDIIDLYNRTPVGTTVLVA